MPPAQPRRVRLQVTMPSDWRDALARQARRDGIGLTALYRKAVVEYFINRRVELCPDTIGVFSRQPTTKREQWLARRREIVRRYRQRLRERAQSHPETHWQIQDAGCITTAELAALAQAVGHVSPDGTYTAETHRYQMPVIVQAVQAAMDRGELTDARWPLFITRYQERTE